MSQSLDSTTRANISQPLSTTSARLVAVHVKSANKNIFRALLSLASASLLMRLMGLVNLFVVTFRFGQGSEMDAYFVAAAVPTLLAQLLGSALESSVIPVYTRIRAKGKEAASRLFSTLLNILIISMILFVVVILLSRNYVVLFSAPGLKEQTQHLAVGLTPFIFPVLLFMVLNTFMECILNAEGQFGWPAYAGMLVPLTAATFVLFAGATYGVVMLCLGTVAGQMIQLAVIIIRAHQAHIRYRLVLDLRGPGVASIAIVAWPALSAALISQASPLVDLIFSSRLSPGSISSINNALKLTSVPIGVIFASVGRAALPYLSAQAATKDMKAFKETFRLYLWIVALSTLLIASGMIILAHPLVQLLFQRGAFTPEDTNRTAITLIGFSIGLTPMSIGYITSGAFNAMGKTRVLLFVTMFSIIANAVFDYIFGSLWQSFGIALATSAVYICTMSILLFTISRMIGKLHLLTPPGELRSIRKSFARWVAWKETHMSLRAIPYAIRKQIIRIFIMLAVFMAAVVGAVKQPTLTLAAAFGSVVILVFLRYQYALLLVWALISVFIGSILPIFNGNHLLSGLTIPTLLLLFYLPTRIAFQQMKALAMLLIFLLWVFLSIGISPLTTSDFLTQWTTLLDFVGVGVLTVLLVTTRQRLLKLIDAMFVPAVFICLYGIYGYLTKHNGVIDPGTGSFRIASIFGDSPTTLSLYLSVLVPLSIYRTFLLQGWKRIIGLALTVLLIIALGLTFTRASLAATFIGIIVMLLFLPSRKIKAALLGVLTAIGSVIALVGSVGDTPIFSRFFNSDVTTLNGRTYLWHALLSHFDPMQILGYGQHASDVLLIRLRVGFGGNVIDNAAHDIFLEALYDHGIIGLALFILTLLLLGGALLLKMRHTSYEHRLLLAMAIGTFTSVFIQCFVTNNLWAQSVGIYFWIIMALPFATYWNKHRQQQEENSYLSDEATIPMAVIIPTEERKQMARV